MVLWPFLTILPDRLAHCDDDNGNDNDNDNGVTSLLSESETLKSKKFGVFISSMVILTGILACDSYKVSK